MKVTHVAPSAFGVEGIFGGGERYPLELARAIAREVTCRLVTFGRRRRLVREAGGLEVQTLAAVAHLRSHPAHPVGFGLLHALADADVVHTHQLRSTPSKIAALAARARRQARVVTDHGLAGTDWRGNLPRLFDRFLTVSQYSSETLRAPVARTRVVYGGVDTRQFYPDSNEQRAGVLFVGRLTPHKGVDRLIRALPAGARLTVVGSEGHDRRRPERGYPALLRELAAGSRGTVAFVAPVPDVELAQLLRRSAVFVLPSVEITCYGRPVEISELLGLTVLEAMASGTPVVCSRVGGVPEIVRDGETGFLVPPGDVAALHDRLLTLLGDRRRRLQMGRSGRELVVERFTWSACAQRCLDAYEDVLRARTDDQGTTAP